MRNVRSGLAAAGLAVGLLVVPAAQAQEGEEPAPRVVASATCSTSALLGAAPACTTRALTCPEGSSCLPPVARVTATAGLGSASGTVRLFVVGDPEFDLRARCGPSPGRCSALTQAEAPEPQAAASDGGAQAALIQNPERRQVRATCGWGGSTGLSLFTGVSCSLIVRGTPGGIER